MTSSIDSVHEHRDVQRELKLITVFVVSSIQRPLLRVLV